MSATATLTRTEIPTGTWAVDQAHSKVGFAVKHMGIATVRGEFGEFEGTLDVGEDLSGARAYGTVRVTSVDTNQPQRDEHLRSADFFDAEKYPEMRFESTSIEQIDSDTFSIIGGLTLTGSPANSSSPPSSREPISAPRTRSGSASR